MLNISRRKGTTDHGSSYEQKIAAFLGVRCALRDDVQDMWIATNVDGLGAFDDLVLFLQKKNGQCSSKEVYLIQVKYKTNKKICLSSGENDLMKYQQSVLKIREDFENGTSPLQDACEFRDIKFLLFTNTQIDASNTQNDKSKNITFSEYESTDDFINTGKIFQISHDPSNAYNSEFNKQTLFYANQVDVSKVENIIMKTDINNVFTNCSIDPIIKFFENWHSGHFENTVLLTKEQIQSIILQTVLSIYVPEPTMTTFPKADIWNQVANQYQFISLKDEGHLEKLWYAVQLQVWCFFDDQNTDLLKWNEPLEEASRKINKIKECFPNVQPPFRKVKSLYKVKDLYLLLWQVCKLPLILNMDTNNNSKQDIHIALTKLDSLKTSKRHYIFLGQVTGNFPENLKNFNILDVDVDVQEKVWKNTCISLQDKEAVTLEKLRLSEAALKKITPDLLIELLKPITEEVESIPDYVSRFIRQPIAAINVLSLPDAVFVIIDDSVPINVMLFNRFGPTETWYMYKSWADEMFHKINIGSGDLEKIKNITLYKDADKLKEYIDIENVIKNVRKCDDQTIHYLRYLNENTLEWLFSNKNANQIKPFLILNSENYLSDSKLFEYLTFNILSGNAGEGKSTLLQFLANNSPSDVWVIKLNMREIEEYIEKGDFSKIKNFLYSHSNNSFSNYNEFSWNLFQSLYDDLNMLLIIDGIDELQYKTKTETFLDAVKSLGIKTVIAIRPSMKDSLEKQFHTLSLFFKPLTNEECQSLILVSLQNTSRYKSEEIPINGILAKLFLYDNIIGVPLLLKLFVSLLNDDLVLDFNAFDISDLYDRYIDEQLKKVKSCNKSTKRTLSRSALFVLYNKESISELFTIEEYFEDIDDKIQTYIESKLIEKLNDNKTPIFAHKSLAEFLVARYLSQLAEKPVSEGLHKFLKSLFYKELETVRLFFDIITLKGSELQDIIVNRTNIELCNKISLDSVDKFGRTGLHIAASYGIRCELRTTQSLWSGLRMYEIYNDVSSNNVIKPCPIFERKTVVPLNLVAKFLENGLDPFMKDNLFKMDVFEFAVESGSLEIIEALYGKHFIKHLENVNHDVLLFYVIIYGYENIYRELKNKNFNLETLPNNDNLLHIALFSEKLEIIKDLTNSVIPIDKPNIFGDTPLISWLALGKLIISNYSLSITFIRNSPLNDNQLDILTHLIGKGVNLNATNDLGETPLHIFCGFQKQSLVETLIRNGADVNRTTKLGDTPLHYASRYSLDNVKLLLKYQSPIHVSNNIGLTPLCYAADNNRVDIVKYLIRKGAFIHPSREIVNPLNVAVAKGHVDCAQLFIRKGAKISNKQINNTLRLAISSGDLKCVNLLLENGAKVYEWMFILAVFLNHKHLIKLLLSKTPNLNINQQLFQIIGINNTNLLDIITSYGADVNAKDEQSGATPLHVASSLGLKQIVEYLIKRKSIVNMEDKNGATPLSSAAGSNSLEIVQILIDNGSDLKKYGSSAIYAAAKNGNSALLDYLTSVGADVNAANLIGFTPIHKASGTNLNCVKHLIRKGAIIKLKTITEGFTALHIAASCGHTDIVEYLIQSGAEVNEEDALKDTALTVACHKGHLECVKFLVDKGSDLHKYGARALFLAMAGGHIPVIDVLISAGVNINSRIDNNLSTIHEAVSRCDLDIVKYLLNKGADINLKTLREGNTPLILAALNGHKDIVEYLIESGARLEEEHVNRGTALTVASQGGHVECVELLVEKGSNIQKYGPLAIYFAATNEHPALVDYLISMGADINGIIDNDRAPIHIASFERDLRIMKYLVNKGADINSKTLLQGFTSLMIAASRGRKHIIEYLSENGANLNQEDANQRTALIFASGEGHLECVKVLVDKGSDVGKYGALALYHAMRNVHNNVTGYLISLIYNP